MKGFRYRLARVLRVREVQGEIARIAWQEAEASSQAARESAASMRRARAQAGLQLSSDLESGEIGAAAMIPGHRALDTMDRAAGRLERNARTLALQAEELRRPFEERRREVRGLERLRDKRLREHRQENLREESAELDEVATTRASRPDLQQWAQALRARSQSETHSHESEIPSAESFL